VDENTAAQAYRSEYVLSLPRRSSHFDGYDLSAAGLVRSASSAAALRPLAKPLRRSKSYLQHDADDSSTTAGTVTFISVNNEKHSDAFGHSHTLPRAVARASSSASTRPAAGAAADDGSVVITRRAGNNCVRIQIGSWASNAQQAAPVASSSEVSQRDANTAEASRASKRKKKKQQQQTESGGSRRRKYTLEELERDEFRPSSETSDASKSDAGTSEDDDVDLNSLIEGAVDDDEEEETSAAEVMTPRPSRRSSRIERVDDAVSSDEDTHAARSADADEASLAVHQGSLVQSHEISRSRGEGASSASGRGARRLLPEKPPAAFRLLLQNNIQGDSSEGKAQAEGDADFQRLASADAGRTDAYQHNCEHAMEKGNVRGDARGLCLRMVQYYWKSDMRRRPWKCKLTLHM
jgi:hypothetical protein